LALAEGRKDRDGAVPAFYRFQQRAGVPGVERRPAIHRYRGDEKVDLKGDAHLSQEGNDFRGELIEYDIRAGRVDAASEKPERIRMTLQPKRSKDDASSAADPEG